MRYGVALVVAVGLLIALPAGARQQAETVTVRVGQTVPLKTVFDKKQTFTIVMSGLITRTLDDGSSTVVYDPFHGMQAANCLNSGPSVYLQIADAGGPGIDYGTAGQPPCRKDHRYEFQVNKSYPPIWDLHGKAKAYITLGEAPGWTTTGSFELTVRPEREPRRDVTFKVSAKKEFRASARDPLLADVRLSGAGRIADLDGARTTRGIFHLTLVWLTRDDTFLTLKPTGNWRYVGTSRYVKGPVQVVRSSDGTCLKPRSMSLLLHKRLGTAQVFLNGCNGVDFARWNHKSSDLTFSVNEVRAG